MRNNSTGAQNQTKVKPTRRSGPRKGMTLWAHPVVSAPSCSKSESGTKSHSIPAAARCPKRKTSPIQPKSAGKDLSPQPNVRKTMRAQDPATNPTATPTKPFCSCSTATMCSQVSLTTCWYACECLTVCPHRNCTNCTCYDNGGGGGTGLKALVSALFRPGPLPSSNREACCVAAYGQGGAREGCLRSFCGRCAPLDIPGPRLNLGLCQW